MGGKGVYRSFILSASLFYLSLPITDGVIWMGSNDEEKSRFETIRSRSQER
jgi:hypothetical protein